MQVDHRCSRRILMAVLGLAALALNACGGGDTPAQSVQLQASPTQAVAALRMRALAVSAQSVAPEEAARQLMDYGERQFPQYFPGGASTQSFAPFVFRYYPQTGAYLGVVVTAGQGYDYLGVYVMGGAFGAQPQFVGPLTQFVQPTAAPRIETQPDDRVVAAGAAAEFAVVASGEGELAYQWYRDGQPIAGARAATLRIASASSSDQGMYSVVVRSPAAAEVTSNQVALIVTGGGSAAVDSLLQRNQCLACHTLDRPLVGPSWLDISRRYAGQSGQVGYLAGRIRGGGVGVWGLVPAPALPISESDATVVAQWLVAGVQSAGTAPTLTATPPASQLVALDGSVRLSVSANGSAPLSYQWRRNGVDIAGATSAQYDVGPLTQADHEATFTVLVRNLAGSVRASTVLRIADPAAYPDQAITLIVPAAAGTALDQTARILADTFNEWLPSRWVTVQNIAGSGGAEAIERLVASPATGYTLLFADIGVATLPALYPQRQLDPLRDLEPLGLLVQTPLLVAGARALPAGGYAVLDAWWRTGGRSASFGHAGSGHLSQLCAVALAERAGLPFSLNTYQGTAPLLRDLADGRFDLTCLPAPGLASALQSQVARGYAVTGLTGSIVPALTDIETLDRSGLAGFEVSDWQGLYARRGTSPVVLARLQQAMQLARQDSALRSRLVQRGWQIVDADHASVAAHGAYWRSETERWAALIARNGLRP